MGGARRSNRTAGHSGPRGRRLCGARPTVRQSAGDAPSGAKFCMQPLKIIMLASIALPLASLAIGAKQGRDCGERHKARDHPRGGGAASARGEGGEAAQARAAADGGEGGTTHYGEHGHLVRVDSDLQGASSTGQQVMQLLALGAL